MKIIFFTLSTLFLIFLCNSPGISEENNGQALYEKLCARCHPDGGNIMKPDKPLFRKSLEAHDIKTPDDIVNVMRNPGKGMIKFTKEKLSDDDAKKVAEYILETFQ